MGDFITKKSGSQFANMGQRDKEIQRVIDYVLKPYYKKSYRDDLFQECWLYALEKESPFEGTLEEYAKYLKVSLEGLCYNYVNVDRGNNRIYKNPFNVQLDEVAYEADDYSVSKVDLVADEIDLEAQIIARDLLEHYTKEIGVRDLKILHLIHEGYSPAEVVAEFRELNLTSERQVFRILKNYKNDYL